MSCERHAKVVTSLLKASLAAIFLPVEIVPDAQRYARVSMRPFTSCAGRPAPLRQTTNYKPRTKKNQPQVYHPWLVFNCVLLQQFVKLD
ncbi:hypothetical protein DLM46_09140 [Paraburkholderia lacunae]|uniref:Uncharacterized protein n=1 Tax=Paraburkholderia lacunae TaxID=2211104 RepID=A0A370NBT3_9BURK|nr:hypothetical protein DLM46_09140 [Paraburkholderia lacunae]